MSALKLDHLVIAVRDLDAATDDYAALFGRAPSWRGEHPRYGTRNTLFRIENTYVELLSLGGSRRDKRWTGPLSEFLERGEGLYALAFGTEDIDQTVREVRDAGLEVQDAADGSGVDAVSGAVRGWRNAMVPVKASRGVRVFFIEHLSPPDALPVAQAQSDERACVRRLDHVVVLSADMEKARQLWSGTLDVRLALDRTFPDRNTRILFYRAGDVTIEISGGAKQTEEGMGKLDRLWGVAWGVDDIDAATSRLRARGVEVSDVRAGIKPGTRVATVKGAHPHGAATLLIEHSPESYLAASREAQGTAYDNTTQRRAFQARSLHSVTVAATDADAAAGHWSSVLGLGRRDAAEPEHGKFRAVRLDAGNAQVDLVQALSPEQRIAQWIEQRGPGMYAIAIEVDDLNAAIADLRTKGVLVSDAEYGTWPGTRVARVNRSAANGVSIELLERLPEVL